MAIHGIDADEAFNLLRQQSQASNVRLRIIAADLVEQLSKPNTQAGTMDRNGQRSDGVAM